MDEAVIMNLVFVYITNPTEEEAKRTARRLLEKRLIACANIFPVKSLYWWKGSIADESEFVLIAKTAEENFERVREEVESTHSYDVPCITKLPAAANKKYSDWLQSQLR